MSHKFKSRFKYDAFQLANAIAAVKNGSKIADAAREFYVPRQTLSWKLKNNQQGK